MEEWNAVLDFAKAAGVPTLVVAAAGALGYLSKVAYKLGKNLSSNPGLGAHLESMEGLLRTVVTQQQDSLQELHSIGKDIAVIKDRGERG